jgi:hypothetical protein
MPVYLVRRECKHKYSLAMCAPLQNPSATWIVQAGRTERRARRRAASLTQVSMTCPPCGTFLVFLSLALPMSASAYARYT